MYCLLFVSPAAIDNKKFPYIIVVGRRLNYIKKSFTILKCENKNDLVESLCFPADAQDVSAIFVITAVIGRYLILCTVADHAAELQ